MRILVADDHPIVRRGLKEILAEIVPGARMDEAASASEVLSRLAAESYWAVLLDINMPGRSGLDILPELKLCYPKMHVLILSVQPEDQYALRCLRAGADAYIGKDCAPVELEKAIGKIRQGGRYIGERLAEQLMTQVMAPAERLPHELLSNRELEVLRMIAEGVALKEIAARLNVSGKTVSSYRSRILLKMGMENNASLVRYAMSHALVQASCV